MQNTKWKIFSMNICPAYALRSNEIGEDSTLKRAKGAGNNDGPFPRLRAGRKTNFPGKVSL